MSHLISTKIFTKISELDEAVGFNTADEFVVVNDAVTQKITGYNLTESIVSMGNLATKAYVDAIVDGAPVLLDTLNELAAALNDDENFATTITALIGTKLASSDFPLSFDNSFAAKTTSNLGEGDNLYYTQARFDSAFAAKTTTGLVEGENLYWTQARFDEALGSKSTSDTIEGSNLYWTQARFDSALSNKTTSDINEGSNLYFTEQRVLDIITAQPANKLVNGSKEVVLQSNGYVTLPNGAQLYDYGSGTGNGYGITDSQGSTYIGYDPGDNAGALHMDAYNGKNIRIRTTIAGTSNYKDWIFETDGTLTLPASPTSDSHAATKGYVDSQVDYVVAGQGFATLGYVEDAIGAVISTARTAITAEIGTEIGTARTAITAEIGTARTAITAEISTEISTARTAITAEIDTAISTARTAITAEISTEISTARTAITAEIDTAISTAELDGGEF